MAYYDVLWHIHQLTVTGAPPSPPFQVQELKYMYSVYWPLKSRSLLRTVCNCIAWTRLYISEVLILLLLIFFMTLCVLQMQFSVVCGKLGDLLEMRHCRTFRYTYHIAWRTY
jgi:hypothetical protein